MSPGNRMLTRQEPKGSGKRMERISWKKEVFLPLKICDESTARRNS